jgi:hypothetical protein
MKKPPMDPHRWMHSQTVVKGCTVEDSGVEDREGNAWGKEDFRQAICQCMPRIDGLNSDHALYTVYRRAWMMDWEHEACIDAMDDDGR